MRRNYDMLRVLAKSKPSMTKAIIKTADGDVINAVCECCLNVLKGTITLYLEERKWVRKNKERLRSLVKKNVSIKKKKALIQSGGFLSSLLLPVLSVVGSLIK